MAARAPIRRGRDRRALVAGQVDSRVPGVFSVDMQFLDIATLTFSDRPFGTPLISIVGAYADGSGLFQPVNTLFSPTPDPLVWTAALPASMHSFFAGYVKVEVSQTISGGDFPTLGIAFG